MKTLNRLAATAATAAAGLSTLVALPAVAAPVVVDVTGAQSLGLQGEAGNTVWLVNVGANAVLNSLSWSVDLEAFEPSVLSEMQISFGGSSGLDLLSFAPGDADFFSGTGQYSGSLDLSPFAMSVGADGLLRLEFSESYKDFAAGIADGRWLGGTLTFDVTAAAVPEPASALLAALGLGLVGVQTARRRRSADASASADAR